MAKVNNTRKSDSWKPGMVANSSGKISKNQKRKEKRLSLNLSALKSQDTPTKKSMLGPLSKFKENINQSLDSGKKTQNKLLSTSLPIKGDKKLPPSPLKKNIKLPGILSNSNTPKSKGNKVTFNMSKNVNKFIDSEAQEEEVPITDKVVKPYEKGSQQKQQLKRRMSVMDVESEDEESGSDDDSVGSPTDFLDMEASEGEETDSLDEEESFDESSDDDFLTAGSDEDVDDEENEIDEDMVEDGDSDENDDSEADLEENDDSEDESEDESLQTLANTSKVVTPNRRESVAAVKQEKVKSTPKKVAVKAEPITPQSKKVNVKIESETKKMNVKAEPTPKKVNVQAEPAPKNVNLKAEALVKEKAQDEPVEKKTKSQKKGKKEKEVEGIFVGETSRFIGFIRSLPERISVEDLKSALSTKIEAEEIVGIRITKGRNVFVYLKDEDTLNLLLNYPFVVDENFKFNVYKARDSASEKTAKFVAFLPRVPIAIPITELKDAIEKSVGNDCVEKIQPRRVFKMLQTRNVLVHFTDVESLQKMAVIGVIRIGSHQIAVRSAFETTVDVPTYKVLFTLIPEKTTEAALKKAIESKVGANSVLNVQFSQKKSSFAFVTLQSEEVLKKTLEVGKNVSVNGTKLEVTVFKPKMPTKKRAAPSELAKDKKKKNKAKKRKAGNSGTAKDAPNSTNPVVAKSKKNKQFPKPGKDGRPNQEPQSPVKGPAPGKGANVKQKAQTSAEGAIPETGANVKRKPQAPTEGVAPGKGANVKKEPQTPAEGDASKKGFNAKQRQKKFKKGASSPKSQTPSPVSVSVNGFSPSNSKQMKKKKNNNNYRQRQQQQQQQSPKPVDAKKQALVEKIAAKKKNKKNSIKGVAS